jgi:hypothetical protein
MTSEDVYEAVSKVYGGRGLTKTEFNLRLKWAGKMAKGMSPGEAASWTYLLGDNPLQGSVEVKEFKKIKELLKKES